MLLFFIPIGLCVSYLALFFLLPKVLRRPSAQFNQRSIISILGIFVLSLTGYAISFSITDEIISNRFLHFFGGGFLGFLLVFLAVWDTRLRITRWQFFFLAFLLVTALGVGNELVEFFLQNYADYTFSTSVNDTWLDLLSNTLGILTAAIILTPFISKKATE